MCKSCSVTGLMNTTKEYIEGKLKRCKRDMELFKKTQNSPGSSQKVRRTGETRDLLRISLEGDKVLITGGPEDPVTP